NDMVVYNLLVRPGYVRRPALTAIDAHEKSAPGARVQGALDARVDGEREDLDFCAWEARVDGAPAFPAVRAFEQAVSLRPGVERGRTQRITDEPRRIGAREATTDGTPALSSIRRFEQEAGCPSDARPRVQGVRRPGVDDDG